MSAFQRVCYKFSVASSGPNCATPGYLRHGGGAGGRAFATMQCHSVAFDLVLNKVNEL